MDGNPALSRVDGALLRVAVNDLTLLDVDLSKCRLGDEALGRLATALDRNATALSLDLSKNGKTLTDAGLRALLPALAANKTLQAVSLDGNKHVGATMRLAVDVALNDPSITEVKLVGAGVDNDGARDLAVALAHNRHVRSVDLRENPELGEEGKHALWDRFRASKRFKKLELDGWSSKQDSADFSGFPVILRRVQKNDPMLLEVKLVSQELTDTAHVQPLAEALAANTAVTGVDLELNKITDRGVRMLLRMLGRNDTITSLKLGHQYGFQMSHALKERCEALARDPRRNAHPPGSPGAATRETLTKVLGDAKGPAAAGAGGGGASPASAGSAAAKRTRSGLFRADSRRASRRALLSRAMSSSSLHDLAKLARTGSHLATLARRGSSGSGGSGAGGSTTSPSPRSKLAMLGRSPSMTSLQSRLSTSSRLSRRRQTLVMDAPFSKRVMDKLAEEGVIKIRKGKGKGRGSSVKGKKRRKKKDSKKKRKKRKSKQKSAKQESEEEWDGAIDDGAALFIQDRLM